MKIQITNRDIIWSYASHILQTGSGVILLPLILNKLSPEELAIWYVFLAITALVTLLDFGLQTTIMRNISYIFSGARELSKEGVIIQKVETDIDYSLLKSMIKTTKRLYMIIAFIVALIMLSAGSRYIRSITETLYNQNEIILAWYIYILSIALNFYFYYYTPLLMGRGMIAESNQTITISKIAFVLSSIVGLSLGYGLIAVAVGNLIGSFINRVTSYYYFYDEDIKSNLKSITSKEVNLLPILWTNAYKLGLVSIGTFLILKGNTLIASKYLDLKIVAMYGLSLQLIMLLADTSSIFFRTYIPRISNNRMIGNNEGILNDYSQSLFIMNFIYLIGSIIILLFANRMLSLVGSKTSLLPNAQVFVLLVIIYLETNHSNCGTLITTKNVVPFVKPALISGIGILLLSLLSVTYLDFGLWGMIASQGLVQLAYNNWKWPHEISKDLGVPYLKIIILGFINIKRVIKFKVFSYHS